MRFSRGLRVSVVAAATVATIALSGGLTPAQARVADADQTGGCFEPARMISARPTVKAAGRVVRKGADTRAVSPREQRAITAKARQLARAKGPGVTAVDVPVYIHVMLSKSGVGNATQQQLDAQIDVLNATYGGAESPTAANTGFTFTLAGVDRYYNDKWHVDKQSAAYRAATRQGGANALNIWLVDFDYLGIATFPWDYSRRGAIDGIRVHVGSIPGGPITNYNLGETATHEAGHWLGLFHTFQGGCTDTNDQVDDTPAQASPTSGCPTGRDSCAKPGLDPIHNYMDYSYDTCYTEFTLGQSARMATMWTAYRS